MIEQPTNRIDESAVMAAELFWKIDPGNDCWLYAEYGNEILHLRLNPAFPDEPLWSLLVAADETLDFDGFPPGWRRVDDLKWPDSADRSVLGKEW